MVMTSKGYVYSNLGPTVLSNSEYVTPRSMELMISSELRKKAQHLFTFKCRMADYPFIVTMFGDVDKESDYTQDVMQMPNMDARDAS